MSKWIAITDTFIKIDLNKCTGCGSCVVICGGVVLEIREGKAIVARLNQCLECANCEVICPTDAIQYTMPKGGTGIVYECG